MRERVVFQQYGRCLLREQPIAVGGRGQHGVRQHVAKRAPRHHVNKRETCTHPPLNHQRLLVERAFPSRMLIAIRVRSLEHEAAVGFGVGE